MKSPKSLSKRKLLVGIKYLAVLVVGGIFAYSMKSYFEFPSYIIFLFFLAIAYAEYRINWLQEKIGLAELPTFEDQMDFLDQKAVPPKHVPADPNSYPLQLTKSKRQFFDDFDLFADVANYELHDTPWRLQTIADTDVGTLESEGPMFGRKYAIYFGAKKSGRLKVHCLYDYSDELPNVFVKIEIYNARRFPLWLLGSIISPIVAMTCSRPEEVNEANMRLNSAMLNVLWPLNQQVVNVDELELQFSGNATNYLARASAFS
jgi:hypothetical protein